METPDDAEKEYDNHNSSLHSDALIKKAMLEQGISCGPSMTDPDQNQSSGATDMEAHQVEVSNESKGRKGKRVMEFEETPDSFSKRKKKIDDDNLKWVNNVDLRNNLNFEHAYDLNFPPFEVKEEDLFPLLDLNGFWGSNPSNLKSSWSNPSLSWELRWGSTGAGPSNSKDKSEEFLIWPQLWFNAKNSLFSLPEIQNSETTVHDEIEGKNLGVIDTELRLCTSDEVLDPSLKH